MHLLPVDEQAGRRIIDDDHRVCAALSAVPDRATVVDWADRFAILADPSRLTLLLCIQRAGRICVSDLAVAAGLKDTTVSQALRFLRAHHLVQAHREGRLIRYQLADSSLRELLDQISADGSRSPGGEH